MLRGFRWQFVVFIMALVLFAITLIARVNDTTPPAVPTPTLEVALIATPIPASTPLPTVIAPNIQPINDATSISETPTYHEALVGTIQRLNPLLASLNPVDRDITSLIFEGLTRVDQYGEVVPDLAQSWVISSDGLEYIIHLRTDVLWQDGAAFSAADVIYTISLLQSTDFPGDPALGEFWQTVEIQQLDDHLVRFRLTQPLGDFLDTLQIGILPEHALRGTTAKQLVNHPFNLTPIGTGPYQLEAIRADANTTIQTVDLRAAPAYRQRPEGASGYAMDRLSFHLFATFDDALKALQSGDVDGLAARSEAERQTLIGLSGISVHTALQPTLGVLIFNWAKDTTKFFRELRVRVALQTGLDRSSIIQRYLQQSAVRADSPLVPGLWAYSGDLPWPRPDLTAAKQLLETANLRKTDEQATQDASSGILFAFSILTPNDPASMGLVQDIANQWSQLDIHVTVDPVDPVTYQSRLTAHDFDAALVELSLGSSADPDVYQFWDQGQYPDGKNYGGVDDRHIAEELERARRDPSGINRAIRYQNFQLEFVERAIAIPLYYPLFTYVTSRQIAGIQLGFMGSPASRFYTIRDWTIAPPA